MKTKTTASLRKIPPSGSIHQQFKKCGKSNCRCAKGERHGPYYYHFVYIDGKLKNRYLKANELEVTQKACLLRRSQQKEHRINSDKAWQKLRKIRESLRSVRNLYLP